MGKNRVYLVNPKLGADKLMLGANILYPHDLASVGEYAKSPSLSQDTTAVDRPKVLALLQSEDVEIAVCWHFLGKDGKWLVKYPPPNVFLCCESINGRSYIKIIPDGREEDNFGLPPQ